MPPAAEADAIAMQVDHDLDGLTDAAAAQGPPAPMPVHAAAAREDDPAEFMLDAPTPTVPPPAAATGTQAANAKLSNALAAIETELFAGGTPPGPRASSPATTPKPSAAKPMPIADGPLAALMAMSEEERIALFS